MKGSILKLGQQLSIFGEYFLPESTNKILRKMQYDSGGQPWNVMEKILRKNLPATFFAEHTVSETPLATASIGQVHIAINNTTQKKLCLKIQYPKIDRFIESDLKLLKFIMTAAKFLTPSVATDEIFKEVAMVLKAEAKFDQELMHTQFFQNALRDDPFFKVVVPVTEFCTRRVLATEYVAGEHINSPVLRPLFLEKKASIGPLFLDLLLREIFVFHRIQSDPHGGNFIFSPQLDAVTLIDFGATRVFSSSFIKNYKALTTSALRDDFKLFLAVSEKMELVNVASQHADSLKAIFELLKMTVIPFIDDKPFDFGASDLPRQTIQKSYELLSHFKITSPPREFIFLNRKIAGTYTLLKIMNAEFNPRPILEKYLN